jgi:hypothetical protein
MRPMMADTSLHSDKVGFKSIAASCSFQWDSNATDVSDSHPEKHVLQTISTEERTTIAVKLLPAMTNRYSVSNTSHLQISTRGHTASHSRALALKLHHVLRPTSDTYEEPHFGAGSNFICVSLLLQLTLWNEMDLVKSFRSAFGHQRL